MEPYDICRDTPNIIAPAMVFPINTPNSAPFILILKIDTNADPLHDPVVRSGTPTNTIRPSMLAAFSFFARLSIF